MATRTIRAAGTVALRDGDEGREVLLVHRQRYDDWSLPKGKAHTDEPFPVTAVRETAEETGCQVNLGLPLDLIRYDTPRGPKKVFFWMAHDVREGTFVPGGEVDEVRWWPVSRAEELMTYGDERRIVNQALEMPDATPLVLVRHGKAMLRKHWSGKDAKRPVNSRGRKQSQRLIPLLAAYGVHRLVSSTSTRCRQTLEPYAEARQLPVEAVSLLSEEEGEDQPAEVEAYLRSIRDETGAGGVPLAVCGHRPVIPAMQAGLDLPTTSMQTGSSVTVHVGADGEVLAVEWHRSLA